VRLPLQWHCPSILTCGKARTGTHNGSPDRPEGLQGGIIGSAQDEADVGMGHKAAWPIQHKGGACLTDLDGRDHIPDQLQVDLGHDYADRWPVAAIATVR
jgi:hypothetical protein